MDIQEIRRRLTQGGIEPTEEAVACIVGLVNDVIDECVDEVRECDGGDCSGSSTSVLLLKIVGASCK